MDTKPTTAALIGAAALSLRSAQTAEDAAPKAATRPLFVAAGHQGLRIVSENGTDWTNLQIGKEGEYYRAVAFGNGRYVAAGTFGGQNVFASSADGVKWETRFKDGQHKNYVRGLGFGKGLFIAIGGEPVTVGASAPILLSSPDGVKWSDYILIKGKNILRRIAFGNGLFVGVGDRGRRAASSDGTEWKDAPDVKAIDTLVDVAFGKGVFVGVGLHGLRMKSDDGLKWSERLIGEEGEHLNSILWAGDRFVAVGMGATYTSPDGTTWKRESNKNAPLTVAYGNNQFIGSNWRGRILRSTDALDWREVFKAEHHIEAIGFGG